MPMQLLRSWFSRCAAGRTPSEDVTITQSSPVPILSAALDREALLHAPQVGEYAWHAFTADQTLSRTSLEHLTEIERTLTAHGVEKRGARLLEVGAYRHYTGYLAADRWQMEVTLTDIAGSSLRAGREAARAAGIEALPCLVAADFHDLPMADDQFDIVFVASTLHHTRSPERVLREIWRVLRPGGLLVLDNEPCSRLACFHCFASNRPDNYTALERALDERGLLRTISSPFPGSRPETVFGMVENDRIPVRTYRDELSAHGEILEWQLQTATQIGPFETSLLALKGRGAVMTQAVHQHLEAAIDPTRAYLGETERLLHFTLPDRQEIAALAARIARALEALPSSEAERSPGLASLFGAALKAVARKKGTADSAPATGRRFRRIMREVDGLWEETRAHRSIAAVLRTPRWPDIYRPENEAALAAFVPSEEWQIEREAFGANSLLIRGAEASLRLDTQEEGVLVLRLYAVVERGIPFTLRVLADYELIDSQLMVLTESRLVRAWVPAGTARVRLELRTQGGAPFARFGAVRLGVAQFIPASAAEPLANGPQTTEAFGA